MLNSAAIRDVYRTPRGVRAVECRKLLWAKHVARMAGRGGRREYWWESFLVTRRKWGRNTKTNLGGGGGGGPVGRFGGVYILG
jgi:hypothetical protein